MPYLPTSTKGSVIITSRHTDVEVSNSLKIIMDSLDPVSGVALLNSFILHQEVGHKEVGEQKCDQGLNDQKIGSQEDGNQEISAAKQISDFVGGFPLAIIEAGKYITTAAISPTDYLQLLKDHFIFRLPNLTDWQHRRALVIILEDTLASLSSDAQSLAECMAFLNPDNIPEELFHRVNKNTLLALLSTE